MSRHAANVANLNKFIKNINKILGKLFLLHLSLEMFELLKTNKKYKGKIQLVGKINDFIMAKIA